MMFSVVITAFATDISDDDLVVYDSQTGKKLSIIVDEAASQTDKTAASKLQYYLQKCTGEVFEISTSGSEGILIGIAGADKMDMSALEDEGYRIKTLDNGIALAGIGQETFFSFPSLQLFSPGFFTSPE